jgi:NADH-quinone oxidoreductase subunit N
MHYSSLLPEVTLLIGALLILLAPAGKARAVPAVAAANAHETVEYGFLKRWLSGANAAFVIAQCALWVGFVFALVSKGTVAPMLLAQSASSPYLLHSAASRLFTPAALVVTSFALFYARQTLKSQGLWRPELFALLLASVTGALVVISASHFVLIYLGVELMSLPLYAMIALRNDKNAGISAEAALKYFFLGAVASALMLYGFSLMYAATGSLSLSGLESSVGSRTWLILGFFFVLVGLAFKLSLVPFHMWAPDVYAGTPTFLTLFVSTVPKLAAGLLLLRFIWHTPSLREYWMYTLAALSALSMIIGGVVAVAQTDLKRMLAYSTIGHMGYLLLGAMIGSQEGFAASMFYVIAYVMANCAAFGVLLSLSDEKHPLHTLDDFKGLAARAPCRAAVMCVAMFSFAGIPGTIGFIGKFSVIQCAWNNGFIALSILAIVTSVISAFYYLRVIAVMGFALKRGNEEKQVRPAPRTAGVVALALLAINAIAIVLLGFVPSILSNPIATAVAAMWQGM